MGQVVGTAHQGDKALIREGGRRSLPTSTAFAISLLATAGLACNHSSSVPPKQSARVEVSPPKEPSHFKVRLRFLSARIEKPEPWERVKRVEFSPDLYVIAFLNGDAIFLTPPTAVIKSTYEPDWNMVMKDYVNYSPGNKDELTILVFDKVIDPFRSLTRMVSESKMSFSAGMPDGPSLMASVEKIKEQSFRDDKRLGRWSGPIPKELLLGDKDQEWELSFDRVLSLKMRIEKGSVE